MKTDGFKYLAIACLLGACSACDNEEFADISDENKQQSISKISLSAEEVAASKDIETFNYNFLGACDRMRMNRDENLLISPLSAQMALGMLALSADDAAANEIASVLGCSDRNAIAGINRKILQTFHRLDAKVTSNLANSVWHESSYELFPEFKNTVGSDYSADVFPCNLSEAANDINSWCAQKTDNNISQLVSPEDLNSCIITMLNALYFKGEWAEKFSKENTRPYTFHGANGDTTVDMMMDSRTITYSTNLTFTTGESNELGFECAELPFGNGSFSVKLVLPAPGVDINKLADNASRLIANTETSNLANCTIAMPKFKIDSDRIDLGNALTLMGLQCFSNISHFNLFTDDTLNNLYFKISQRSTVEFDEDGAVATSATAISGTISPGPGYKLIFDRPFLFFITEKQTGVCLMSGKVMNL